VRLRLWLLARNADYGRHVRDERFTGNGEKACRSVLDEVLRAVDAPADDDTGISVEINVILRAVGILGPAPADERN
jgi:hypothetical protein